MTAPEPSSQRVADLQQAIKSYIVKDERGYLDEDLLNIAGAQDPRLGKLLLVSEYLVYLAAMLWDQTRKVHKSASHKRTVSAQSFNRSSVYSRPRIGSM